MLSAIAILFPSHHFVCNTMLFYSSSSSSPSSSSSSSSSFWLCMVCRRLSSHWQLPRLRNYLHELSKTFDDLCSSFFGRLLPLLYKGFLDHVAGSVIASCLTYYKNWQENKTTDNSCRTKQQLSLDSRCEGYLRLPFAGDLCLRTAMQGFLKRILSQGKINKKRKLFLSVLMMSWREISPITWESSYIYL